MKQPHRVPLTDGMMAILRALEQIRSKDYLFLVKKISPVYRPGNFPPTGIPFYYFSYLIN